MKTLILSPFFAEDLDYQENLLVKYYEKHGHEVHLVTSTDTAVFDYVADRHDARRPSRTYKMGSATIYRLKYSINLFHRYQRFPDITPILERVRPDLIFVRSILPNITDCIRYLKRHPECRMVLDYHGDFSNSGRGWLSRYVLHGVLRKRLLDRARPHLSRIFPVTPCSADFLTMVYGVPPEEMEVLPLGADLDVARAVRASGARDALRKAYGIAEDVTVFFSGGKLGPNKRTDVLIEAFKRLPVDRASLVVIGDSSEQHAGYLKTLQEIAGGRPNIRFTGWLSKLDVYRHLDLADAAAFGGGQSILWQHAIGAGLPLIIGELVGSEQDASYLNTHDNILFVAADKPLEEGLYDCLTALMDRERRAAMAEGAQRVAHEMLDWDVLINKTLRFVPGESARSGDAAGKRPKGLSPPGTQR